MPDFNPLINSCNIDNFNDIALEIFQFQAKNCSILSQYLKNLGIAPERIHKIEDLVFLPISFFKTHNVTSLEGPGTTEFLSSGTGGKRSRHPVHDVKVYENSFIQHFNHQFTDYNQYQHLALLPNYQQQGNSSLVYQVNHFVSTSTLGKGAFFLDSFSDLFKRMEMNKAQHIPTVLWGVTFALLDFIQEYQLDFPELIVIETGGMKGRGRELTRTELHRQLHAAFPSSEISSEYGMTELFSQAYWDQAIKAFHSMPQLKVLIRDSRDPLSLMDKGRHGAINVIDLNNWQTCSFIETADLGIRYERGFNVLGRMDQAEARGCSLMYT